MFRGEGGWRRCWGRGRGGTGDAAAVCVKMSVRPLDGIGLGRSLRGYNNIVQNHAAGRWVDYRLLYGNGKLVDALLF